MRRFLIYYFMFITVSVAFAQTKAIAHRGFWDTENSAQNSITSLYKASEVGFYGSEFDVQMTLDSVLVIFHDSELNGKKITETKFDAVRDYLLSNGEIIPTLEQFLIHARNYPNIQLILEINIIGNVFFEICIIQTRQSNVGVGRGSGNNLWKTNCAIPSSGP